MEKKKRIIPVWLTVTFTVLCAVSFLISAFLLAQGAAQDWGTLFNVSRILDCVAFLAALLYCATGFRKSSAVHFKIFCAAYLLSAAAFCYGKYMMLDLSLETTVAALACSIIVFLILIVFNVTRNLGVLSSMVLAGVMVLCDVFNVVIRPDAGFAYLLILLARVVLSAMFFLMVFAKYADKTARHTT